MNKTARDRSERDFGYFIAILALIILVGVLFEINDQWIIGGISFISSCSFFRSRHISKRSKQDTSVISQIIKDE